MYKLVFTDRVVRYRIDLMLKVILVVDDEPILREIVKDYLELSHYSVLEAENGRVAFEMIQKQKIDCVISDIRMPGGSGIELAENLFAMKSPKPKLILMTGFSDFTWEQAKKLEVTEIMAKPFEPESLLAQVKKVIEAQVK